MKRKAFLSFLRKNKMDESSNSIHPERLKSFVRHVCVVAKKHKDRGKARVELRKQVERVKRFSSEKKGIDKELKELDGKISLVLEKERQLLGIEKEDNAVSKALMNNVMENKEKINKINESINDMRQRLQDYIEMKTERERRISQLEKKIIAKAGKKKSVSLLESKLGKLEDMYNKLKKKGVDVSAIESRIDHLKVKLSFA